MDINQKEIKGIPVLEIKGELNLISSETVKRVFDDFTNRNINKVIINLSSTDFIDSTGIGLIIEMSNKFRHSGGNLVISSMNKEIKNLFSIANLLDILINFENDDQAIDFLNK